MKESVVLINPPLRLKDRYGKQLKHFGGVTEPLGLAYIAAYLEEWNIPVRIIDAPAENLGVEDIVRDVVSHHERIVGITMLTPMFGVVKLLCSELKKTAPDCLIVLGGAHCTALPEETLREIPEAGIICIGEGELTMAEIAEEPDGRFERIKGICFHRGDRLIRTDPRPYLKDLDRLPPPARHLLPMKKYHLTGSRVGKTPYCPTVLVARGCPFSCSYCSHPLGKQYRVHSVGRIIAEIRELIARYDASQINIEADTVTADRRFIKSLCSGLIEEGINEHIRWTCESRLDTVDEEILYLMKEAGCWQISYGVETGSQRLLDMINKNFSLSRIRETCRITKKVGISIRGFFMLGIPTETREESLNTIAFAIKLDPMWAQFTLTIPYPGTPMFNELQSSGKIKCRDWSKYNTWSGWKGEDEMPFVPEGRTVRELQLLQRMAMRKFYLRPIVFYRFITSIRSVHSFTKFARGVWVLIKSR